MNIKPIISLLSTWFLLSLVFYIVLVGFLYINQGQMIFLPSSTHIASPSDVGLSYTEVWLETEDGEQLHAWYLPAKDTSPFAAPPALLFLHGNAGNISHRLRSLLIWHDLGLSVLILDYRGYGKSSGRPTEVGTYRDAMAGWDYLIENKGYSPEQVIIFGRSLGAAIAARTAVQVNPGAVILESGFASLKDLAQEIYPWIPVRWLLRFDYDTRSSISTITAPILLAHSRNDEIIPFSHFERLRDAAQQTVQLDTLEMQGGHNDGFWVTGSVYRDALQRFIMKNFANN